MCTDLGLAKSRLKCEGNKHRKKHDQVSCYIFNGLGCWHMISVVSVTASDS